jgi:hypothetical protein
MKRFRLFMAIAGLAIALSACKQQSDTGPADAGATAETPAPAPTPDALKKDQVAVVVELESPVRAAADGLSIEIPVKITNKGSAVLSSELRPPVMVGIQITGTAGDMTSEGAVRDFKRASLPLVAPGASVSVVVNVPVNERTAGRKLAIGLVQERVRWFADWGQSDLVVGPFMPCDGKVCGVDGKPL